MQFKSILEELEVTKFRKDVERELEDYFEDSGYCMIEPKIFQNYDEFVCSNLRTNSKKTVKVLSGDSEIYILRPDITMNILQKIFSKWEKDKPLKVYYNSKIYLNNKNYNIKELRQMGIEYLGEDSLLADQEMITMAVELMKKVDRPFILELGSSKYLDSYFEEINIDIKLENKIKNYIAKKNKHGLISLLNKNGIKSILLENILSMQGDMEAVIEQARKYTLNLEMQNALKELEDLKDIFAGNKMIPYIHFDLSMVADLDYYDGIIFKGYYFQSNKKILSGGRYDRLTEKFGRKTSAIGFSIDMDEFVGLMLKEAK
ncbi:MAG: ATP phosphoribosyltransferase regulatory subunit [Bacillota bacterium]|nr:ATP phosphoribosyltransferase regulatory subunit [Bacillota bacterium]